MSREAQWTERKIQDILFSWLRDKGHDLICPNCGVFGWEADIVSVTGAEYGHEYEIKISVSDFRADAKKSKHKYLLKKPKYTQLVYPAQFWYVVPAALITEQDVPAHAGLIYVYRNTLPVIIKQAPRLHKEKLKPGQIRYIARGLMCHFWQYRKGE